MQNLPEEMSVTDTTPSIASWLETLESGLVPQPFPSSIIDSMKIFLNSNNQADMDWLKRQASPPNNSQIAILLYRLILIARSDWETLEMMTPVITTPANNIYHPIFNVKKLYHLALTYQDHNDINKQVKKTVALLKTWQYWSEGGGVSDFLLATLLQPDMMFQITDADLLQEIIDLDISKNTLLAFLAEYRLYMLLHPNEEISPELSEKFHHFVSGMSQPPSLVLIAGNFYCRLGDIQLALENYKRYSKYVSSSKHGRQAFLEEKRFFIQRAKDFHEYDSLLEFASLEVITAEDAREIAEYFESIYEKQYSLSAYLICASKYESEHNDVDRLNLYRYMLDNYSTVFIDNKDKEFLHWFHKRILETYKNYLDLYFKLNRKNRDISLVIETVAQGINFISALPRVYKNAGPSTKSTLQQHTRYLLNQLDALCHLSPEACLAKAILLFELDNDRDTHDAIACLRQAAQLGSYPALCEYLDKITVMKGLETLSLVISTIARFINKNAGSWGIIRLQEILQHFLAGPYSNSNSKKVKAIQEALQICSAAIDKNERIDKLPHLKYLWEILLKEIRGADYEWPKELSIRAHLSNEFSLQCSERAMMPEQIETDSSEIEEEIVSPLSLKLVDEDNAAMPVPVGKIIPSAPPPTEPIEETEEPSSSSTKPNMVVVIQPAEDGQTMALGREPENSESSLSEESFCNVSLKKLHAFAKNTEQRGELHSIKEAMMFLTIAEKLGQTPDEQEEKKSKIEQVTNYFFDKLFKSGSMLKPTYRILLSDMGEKIILKVGRYIPHSSRVQYTQQEYTLTGYSSAETALAFRLGSLLGTKTNCFSGFWHSFFLFRLAYQREKYRKVAFKKLLHLYAHPVAILSEFPEVTSSSFFPPELTIDENDPKLTEEIFAQWTGLYTNGWKLLPPDALVHLFLKTLHSPALRNKAAEKIPARTNDVCLQFFRAFIRMENDRAKKQDFVSHFNIGGYIHNMCQTNTLLFLFDSMHAGYKTPSASLSSYDSVRITLCLLKSLTIATYLGFNSSVNSNPKIRKLIFRFISHIANLVAIDSETYEMRANIDRMFQETALDEYYAKTLKFKDSYEGHLFSTINAPNSVTQANIDYLLSDDFEKQLVETNHSVDQPFPFFLLPARYCIGEDKIDAALACYLKAGVPDEDKTPEELLKPRKTLIDRFIATRRLEDLKHFLTVATPQEALKIYRFYQEAQDNSMAGEALCTYAQRMESAGRMGEALNAFYQAIKKHRYPQAYIRYLQLAGQCSFSDNSVFEHLADIAQQGFCAISYKEKFTDLLLELLEAFHSLADRSPRTSLCMVSLLKQYNHAIEKNKLVRPVLNQETALEQAMYFGSVEAVIRYLVLFVVKAKEFKDVSLTDIMRQLIGFVEAQSIALGTKKSKEILDALNRKFKFYRNKKVTFALLCISLNLQSNLTFELISKQLYANDFGKLKTANINEIHQVWMETLAHSQFQWPGYATMRLWRREQVASTTHTSIDLEPNDNRQLLPEEPLQYPPPPDMNGKTEKRDQQEEDKEVAAAIELIERMPEEPKASAPSPTPEDDQISSDVSEGLSKELSQKTISEKNESEEEESETSTLAESAESYLKSLHSFWSQPLNRTTETEEHSTATQGRVSRLFLQTVDVVEKVAGTVKGIAHFTLEN